MSTVGTTPVTSADIASVLARVAALDERNKLLEEENRWLKAQLYGRSSEKRTAEDRIALQVELFNEIEAIAEAQPDAPETMTMTIPAQPDGRPIHLTDQKICPKKRSHPSADCTPLRSTRFDLFQRRRADEVCQRLTN